MSESDQMGGSLSRNNLFKSTVNSNLTQSSDQTNPSSKESSVSLVNSSSNPTESNSDANKHHNGSTNKKSQKQTSANNANKKSIIETFQNLFKSNSNSNNTSNGKKSSSSSSNNSSNTSTNKSELKQPISDQQPTKTTTATNDSQPIHYDTTNKKKNQFESTNTNPSLDSQHSLNILNMNNVSSVYLQRIHLLRLNTIPNSNSIKWVNRLFLILFNFQIVLNLN